jgi:predicted DCC family thiol-disulfide oxidoreductase YuxK
MPSAPAPRGRPDLAPRPALVYDGDCGICTRFSHVVTVRLRRRESDFAVAAWQHLDLGAYGLTPEECDAAVQWVAADGTVSAAQDAVARTLLSGRVPLRPMGALILVPGINAVAGVVYRWVAANRHRLPGGTPACSLPADQRPR